MAQKLYKVNIEFEYEKKENHTEEERMSCDLYVEAKNLTSLEAKISNLTESDLDLREDRGPLATNRKLVNIVIMEATYVMTPLVK